MRIRGLSGLAPCFVILSMAAGATAQDKDAAGALFDKGVEDMNAGRFDAACPAIAESHRLDPLPGVLYTLADCESQRNRSATATALFDDYLRWVQTMMPEQKAKHADRAKKAELKKAAMAKDVPTLTITLSSGTPSDAKVFRDGTSQGAEMLRIAVPIDPGEHIVKAELPNGRVFEKRVEIKAGEKTTVEIDLAEPPPPPPPPPPAPPPAPPPVVAKPTNALRTGGFVALGVGGLGLAVGGVMGGMAFDAKGTFDTRCPKNTCSNQGDIDAWKQGRTMAGVSTAGFVVGLAGIGTGLVMLVMSRGRGDDAPAKPGVSLTVFDASPAGALFGAKGVFK